MKCITNLLIILLLSGYNQAQNRKGMDMIEIDSRQQTPAVIFTCSMHPGIHSIKPGNCTKCGMKLIQEKQKQAKPQLKQKTPEMQISDTSLKNKSDMGNMQMDMGNSKMDSLLNKPLPKTKSETIKTIVNHTPPRTVRYDLYIVDTLVNFSGKTKRAIAVNGQIPMPVLTFTQGDTAEIYVHNELNEETSLHWHGLFLPNRYDGVPNLTQMPIKPHTTHLYKFAIIQHGTHWYHSHTELQEQLGMYGMFIMNKRKELDIPTIPVVLSEWADMNPKEIHRSLHNATDWFAIKKGTTQSYAEALHTGHFKTKLNNEWKRMNAMDVSDVYYDKFLINGKNQSVYPTYKAGDKIRLRIANGGASDYFWLTYSGGKITVVASDGNDVEPVEVDRLIIAVSETYDVVVTIPENKSYEFLVTPEDRTNTASLWLGSGEKVPAKKLPKLKYFSGMNMMNEMMDMKGNMVEMEGMLMQNQLMDMNTVMYPEITGYEKTIDSMPADEMKDLKLREDPAGKGKVMQLNNGNHSMAGMDMDNSNTDIVTLNYGMLRATEKTKLPAGIFRELRFDLTGNMNRYVWTLDNKTVSESDKIRIKKGENLRIILFNNSMMRHPMHLHGHDFRVLNGQDEYAPMKNIIDIMPMERDTIEFAATESGDWFFHCHILYHMMSGMGRVFSYENSAPNPEIPNPKRAQRKLFSDDRQFHFMAQNSFETNGNDGEAMLSNTRWSISSEWRLGYHAYHGYEVENHIGRYIGRMQWIMPFVGYDYRYRTKGINFQESNIFGQTDTKDSRQAFSLGILYTLPMLLKLETEAFMDGTFLVQLKREGIPVTKRLRMSFMLNSDKEYMAGFRFILSKYTSLSTHYDSDMGLGAGLSIVY
ncbi:MAG: multicopper oxidase domain-containing protein [Bacteroidia bacterium]|nr:multicopper oxidase domain-containing protein [Bacteroidia bacterium]